MLHKHRSHLKLERLVSYTALLFAYNMMDTQNTILAASAIVAITAVVGLSVAQSDQFSRRALAPARLQAKRLQEYAYRWEQSIEKALMRAQIYLAGGVDAQLVSSSQQQQEQQSKAAASKIWDEHGITDLITEWMKQDKKLQKEQGSSPGNKAADNTPFPQILGFSREEESREILVELCHPKSGSYELPLIKFGMVLADILEATLTSTTLCFVADASAGLGSQLVADLLDASKAGVVRFPSILPSIILHFFLFTNKFHPFLQFILGHYSGALLDGGVCQVGC